MSVKSIGFVLFAWIAVSLVVVGCKGGGGGSDTNEALFEAAKVGNIEGMKKAIADGADIKSHASGSSEMGDQGHTALHYAAERGHTEAVKYLLESGADIEAKNGIGNTPLLLAVNFTMTDTVMFLLDKGANINVRNNNGKGVIDHAKKGRPSTKTLDLLAKVEKAGAKP